MPTTDQKFVQRLDDFTNSLEGIVELLKESINRGNVDNVNEMLTNMNDNLGEIVENIREVTANVRDIKNQNDAILREIQEVRRAREAGFFANIAEVDNRKKIINAVEIITLIAGGVLAIGLAFKIIAPVDFLSVIAIGLAITFITGAFVAISKNIEAENLTFTNVRDIAGMMLIMSGAIAVSSLILSLSATLTLAKSLSIIFTAATMGASLWLMSKAIEKSKLKPEDYPKMALLPLILPLIAFGIAASSLILSGIKALTFPQMITTLFVSATIGTALYLITQSLDKAKMEGKHVAQLLLLPIIVPALALGIVISSVILSGIAPLSFGQMVSAIFTAATIGVLIYLMKPAIEKISDMNWGDIGKAALIIVALSAALVGASHILSFMRLMGFREAALLAVNALAIGLSVLFLAPAVYLLKSISRDDMIKASINVIIAAGTIAAASWLLALGNYDLVPDWRWTLGAGLAIVAFAGIIKLLDLMKMGVKDMAIGAVAVIGISATIMAASIILSYGNYDEYPPIGWALGVGLSLVAFGAGMMILGSIIINSGGLAAGALAIGVLGVLLVSGAIAASSYILAMGNYDQYPDIRWSSGVGLSLVAFGAGMMLLGGLIIASGGIAVGALVLGIFASAIVSTAVAAVSWILGIGNYDNYPDLAWAAGVGLSLVAFGGPMLALGLMFGSIVLIGLGAISMLTIAGTIVAVSHILSLGDYEKGPTKEWALGTGALLLSVGLSSAIFAGILPLVLIGGFSMRKIAHTIVDVADILSKGIYTGGPTEEWAKGVGLAIKSFAEGISAMSGAGGGLFGRLFGTDSGKQIRDIASAMVDASVILEDGSWLSFPSEEWSKGVGNSIMAFANAIKALDDAGISPKFEFIFTVMMLSRGLIAAAEILNSFDWASIKNYPTSEWAEGVGKAINAFAEPLSKMGETGVTRREITGGIRRLSEGLIEAAEIIGKYDWGSITPYNYPSSEWVSGVGTALDKFVKYLIDIENNDIGRTDLRILSMTVRAIVTTAKSFAKLEDDVWGAVPTATWADRIGKSLSVFIKYLQEIESKDIGRGEIRNLNRVVDNIINTAKKFARLDDSIWDFGPNVYWAENMGETISKFLNYLEQIEKSDIGRGDLRVLTSTIDAIIRTSLKFYFLEKLLPDVWKTGPTENWAKNIEKSINAFVNATTILKNTDNFTLLDQAGDSIVNFTRKLEKILINRYLYGKGGLFDTFSDSIKNLIQSLPESTKAAEGLDALGNAFLRIENIGITSGDSIKRLTQSILDLSTSLKEVDMESIDKLSKFSNGILILSLIDEKKFEDALSILDKKKNDIVSILSESSTIKSRPSLRGSITLEESIASQAAENRANDTQKFYEELLVSVKSLDTNVGEILKIKKEPQLDEQKDEILLSTPPAGAGSQQTNTMREG